MQINLDSARDHRPAYFPPFCFGLRAGTFYNFGGGGAKKAPKPPKIKLPEPPRFKMPQMAAMPELPPPPPPPPSQTVTSDIQQAGNDARTQALRRKGTRSTIFAGEGGYGGGSLGGGGGALG